MRMVGRLLWANRDVLLVNTAVGTGRGGLVRGIHPPPRIPV